MIHKQLSSFYCVNGYASAFGLYKRHSEFTYYLLEHVYNNMNFNEVETEAVSVLLDITFKICYNEVR